MARWPGLRPRPGYSRARPAPGPTLGPGQILRSEVTITEYYDVTIPGRYLVRVTLKYGPLLRSVLASNIASLIVTAR